MTETNTLNLTLGQQLQQARVLKKLSIEDVEKAINLRKNIIESIENDVFILPHIAPAFVKGYVRSYLRFLRLPAELVDSANYGEVSIPPSQVALNTIKVGNSRSQRRWVMLISALILVIVLGMSFLWWWQERQKDQLAIAPQPVQTAQTASQPKPTQPAPAKSAETAAKPEEAKAAEPATDGDLRIEVTQANSWVTVRAINDGKTKELESRNVNAGEVLSFKENQGYRLTIGAPMNVKIQYKGSEVPLKVDGRVVKLRLPLAQ